MKLKHSIHSSDFWVWTNCQYNVDSLKTATWLKGFKNTLKKEKHLWLLFFWYIFYSLPASLQEGGGSTQCLHVLQLIILKSSTSMQKVVMTMTYNVFNPFSAIFFINSNLCFLKANIILNVKVVSNDIFKFGRERV